MENRSLGDTGTPGYPLGRNHVKHRTIAVGWEQSLRSRKRKDCRREVEWVLHCPSSAVQGCLTRSKADLDQHRTLFLARFDHAVIKIARIVDSNGRAAHALSHGHPIDSRLVDIDHRCSLWSRFTETHVGIFV